MRLPSRIIQCAGLVLLAAAAAFAQAPRGTVAISAAARSGSNTSYTYTLTTGPALTVGESIAITGMSAGNNGTFTITALPAAGMFTVVNTNGATATEAGTGTVAFRPTSGALLSIIGTGASSGVNVYLYDSQIHSGTVQTVPQPNQVSISAATFSSSPNTVYCYTLATGPDLVVGESIVIKGMSNSGNNGTFTITVVTPVDTPNCSGGTSFTVLNANGMTASSQSGTGALNTSNCNANDLIPADTHVTQGGAAAGCDAGDAYEVTDIANGSMVTISTAKQSGSYTIYCYTLTAGTAALTVGEGISITGVTTTTVGVDNGTTFTIAAVTPGDDTNCSAEPFTSFTVFNANGQNGTGGSGTEVDLHTHQQPGKADVTVTGATAPPNTGFHIETHYVCAGACSGGVTGAGGMCNTSNTICTAVFGPDSGFLTVTNNTGSAFSGTISLTGNSPIAGAPFCPAGGAASDTWTSGLTTSGATQSVTLALGSDPGTADSSNCGGFNQPQRLALTAGTTTIFTFGNDVYKFTPNNSNPGDTLSFLPVPESAGPLGTAIATWGAGNFGTQPGPENPVVPSPQRFSATNFPGQACAPFADFSALGNPVCAEIQLTCTSTAEVNDCATFLYSGELDFPLDPNSFPGGIGGGRFLGDSADQCPTTNFNFDNLSFFIGGDNGYGHSGNPMGCFAATFDPTAAPLAAGARINLFVGFQSPVVNDPPGNVILNLIKAGRVVPLKWQFFNSDGTPNPNYSWCPLGPGANPAICSNASVNAPWVYLFRVPDVCPNGAPDNIATDMTIDPNASGFQNFGDGSYQFNWQTSKADTGCTTVVMQLDRGLYVFPAEFQYTH
jgi:hypothetical protein